MARKERYSQEIGEALKYGVEEASAAVDADALADMRAYSNLKERRKKAKRKKAITLAIVGAVVLALVVGGILWLFQSMSAPPVDAASQQTAFVEEGQFLDTISASGKLKPVSSVSAAPEVDGLVGEVFVAEGDTVTAGQTLYTIVNAELDKAVTQAQQGINEASNSVTLAQIAVDDARRAKQQGLAAASTPPTSSEGEGAGSGGASAPFDVAQADSAIKQAELSLSGAYNALANAQAAYDDAVARAAKRTVTSPINGSVVSVSIEPGKPIGGAAGASTSVPVQIADLSKMVVSVEVNEIDILKVQTEQEATLTFSAIPDLELTGKVTHIATVNTGASDGASMGGGMGGGTVTYAVDILLEAPDARLKPGMTTRATVEFQKLDNVLMVPLSAVMPLSDTEGSVLVVDPEKPEGPEERTVKILASNGLMMAVEGKLSAGDEVMLIGGGGSLGMGSGGAETELGAGGGSVTLSTAR